MPILRLQGFTGDLGLKGATTYIQVNHTGRNDYLSSTLSLPSVTALTLSQPYLPSLSPPGNPISDLQGTWETQGPLGSVDPQERGDLWGCTALEVQQGNQ